MKNEGTKNVLLGVLIVGLVSMTVAFAALSTTLKIENTAEVAAQSWDVEIANWAESSKGPAVTVTPGTVDSTSVTGYNFAFTEPGQSVVYTFNIVNKGTIAANNTSVTVGTPTCYNYDENATDHKGTPAESCPITYTVNCADTALKTNASGYDVLDLTGTNTPGTPVTAGTKACTYTVTLNENSSGNTYNQPRIVVDGLDVIFNYAQN